MGTDDDTGKTEADASSDGVDENQLNQFSMDTPSGFSKQTEQPDNVIETSMDEKENSIFQETVLDAKSPNGNQLARLRVVYSWNGPGTKFTCNAVEYWVTAFDGDNGNILLAFKTDRAQWGLSELTARAQQVGRWVPISGGGTIDGNPTSANIHFRYIFDYSGGNDPTGNADEDVVFYPRMPVVNPVQNVTNRTFSVSGVEGIYNAGKVQLLRRENDEEIGQPAIPSSNGAWSTEVSLAQSAMSINLAAVQIVNGRRSQKTDTPGVVYVAEVTAPSPGSVIATDAEFSGTAAPGTRVKIVKSNSDNDAVTDYYDVKADGRWTLKLDPPLSSGKYSLTVFLRLPWNDPIGGYTPDVEYAVLGMLKITPPNPDEHKEMNFTVTGTNGTPDATVNIRKDLGDVALGSGTVGTGGNWSADVQLTEAGLIRLVAEQTYKGVPSPPSNYETFKIKPPKLVNIQVAYSESGTVTFSGSGYNTATVDVHIKGNVTPVGSGNVRNGTWSVDWSEQPPASHIIEIRQKLSDGQGGWIYSVWADSLVVVIRVPQPTLSARVEADRKPVLSGTGHSWPGKPNTNIQVNVSGPPIPYFPLIPVTNDSWRYTADTAWAPGRYQLKARQLLGVLASGWTSEVSLIVPAPPPTVTVLDNGLTPSFSGDCLGGATVKVWFGEDEGSAEGAQVSDTTWTYSRSASFLPGTYTVNVKQTVNEVISAAASAVFTVVVTKPVITAPAEAQEVDHNPIIEGTGGIPGATMTVFEFVAEQHIDNNEVTADAWSVPISPDLPFGNHKIYAVQQYEGSDSEKSEPVSFTVILFPPTIEHPQPGESVPRKFVIDGYARKVSGLDTAQVELWLEGEDEPRKAKARGHDGYWFYEADLPVGRHVLRAKQIFAGEDSELGTAHDFTVVPAKPVIESPAALQHLGTTATLSGFGYAGDWVEVAWSDAPETLLGRTQVQANRTWSLALTFDKPTGEHSWIMQQVNGDYSSGWSDAHPVMVLSPAPAFTSPEPGQWFAGLPVFHGTGETGKAIELSHWFDTRQRISQGDSVEDGTWSASPDTPLPPASHWVKARQGDSAWGESARFEVDPFGHTSEG
ncbi:hypothetical protein [Pseudomonas sp. R1-7]|uniref:hypothetical protein n=1 Tax=Pseudomonas sp. R1-7 TaxID=2817398 RepID=UPI003DA8DA2C